MIKKRKQILYLVFSYLIFSPFTLVAQSGNQPKNPDSGGFGGSGGGALQNPLKFKTLTEFLTALLDIIITIGFPLIVLAVVYTGFLFVKAQGNPEDLATAKKALLWTLVGALIILGAQALSLAIQGTVDELTIQSIVHIV